MTKKICHTRLFFLFFIAGATFSAAHGQTITDSAGVKIDSISKGDAAIDSVLNEHSPRTASIRSAILPGLGQIYNRSYWKLPIVYGALGTTAYIFFDNLKTYKELRFAYSARYKASLPDTNSASSYPGPFRDSTDFKKLKTLYRNPNVRLASIQAQRDQFRRYVDYTVLVFAAMWVLNIIDASVDAHLKSFDVSPYLSLRFRAGYSELARTAGFGLVLSIK